MGSDRDPVNMVRHAVKTWLDHLGPGLYGAACSGGADSIALADAAIEERAQQVIVVTIDHGLSPGSADVAAAVATWARGRGAAALVRRIEVPREASLEAAARDARYRAFDEIADELGLSCWLLGHTARDQAETVLMRIVRGTGPAGLAGIPARRGRFVRPLLELPRAAIDAYVAARGLPVWDDPMNADPRFTRVRARERILPLLRGENPAIDDALVRLAHSAREWTETLDALAEPWSHLPIDCAALASQPAAVIKRALARALERDAIAYEAVHLDELARLVARPAAGEVAIDLPGARLVRSYETLGRPSTATTPPGSASTGYEVRTWQPGDRMRPSRLKGRSRKLSDLYGDAKLPRAVRASARVMVRVSDGTIVWAEHIGVAFGEPPDLAPEPSHSGGSF